MRLVALAAAVLLARAPAREVCGALNVTVSPGPVVDFLEGDNATLLCHVSQRRRKDSLLAVRWFFALSGFQETLMVKMTKLGVVQYYGNYSRSSHRRRLHLREERRGVLYRLSVLALRPADQGRYICKAQEVSRLRNKWTAWSNGSSATEMRVISLRTSEDSSFEKKKKSWAVFEAVAVAVCCAFLIRPRLPTRPLCVRRPRVLRGYPQCPALHPDHHLAVRAQQEEIQSETLFGEMSSEQLRGDCDQRDQPGPTAAQEGQAAEGEGGRSPCSPGQSSNSCRLPQAEAAETAEESHAAEDR
ncbi:V-set and transmembrane domain-containing protein 4 isoform X2 [Tamandua tetradactyla]|uniref:V-set and transmembrane domain-containing protein 4 isoform X2 n=1 Tax=Tamandua tetradactyla TaxID=48850 RepID=UPI004053BE95